jgi:hypothetical protein
MDGALVIASFHQWPMAALRCQEIRDVSVLMEQLETTQSKKYSIGRITDVEGWWLMTSVAVS